MKYDDCKRNFSNMNKIATVSTVSKNISILKYTNKVNSNLVTNF